MDKLIRQFQKDYPELSYSGIDKRKKKLILDKHFLDDAAVGQSYVYYQVADCVAQVESLRDEAKLTLEESEAKVSMRIRKINTEKKLTEGAISKRVQLDEELKIAHRRFLFLKELTAKWQALRSAFDQRASMLKVLASLYTSNYFATDSVKGDPAFKGAVTKSNRRKLNEKRRRTV